jgi:hypothetical protein
MRSRHLPQQPASCGLRSGQNCPTNHPKRRVCSWRAHVRLWEAARQVLVEQPALWKGAKSAAAIEPVLAAAERRSGVTLREDSVREGLAAIMAERLLPTALARLAVKLADKEGASVCVFGSGWAQMGLPKSIELVAPAEGESLSESMARCAAVALILNDAPAGVRLALELLAAEVLVLLKAPDGGLTETYPGLEDLEPALAAFHGVVDLKERITEIRQALAPDSKETLTRLRDTADLVRRRHRLEHRLHALIEHLQ